MLQQTEPTQPDVPEDESAAGSREEPLEEPVVSEEAPGEPRSPDEPQPDEEIPDPISPNEAEAVESPIQETPQPVAPSSTPPPLSESEKDQVFKDKLRSLGIQGNRKRTQIHQENLQKIMDYLSRNEFISNDTVEEICSVKKTTAWQLLEELEKSGKIIQIGQFGSKVRYKRV